MTSIYEGSVIKSKHIKGSQEESRKKWKNTILEFRGYSNDKDSSSRKIYLIYSTGKYRGLPLRFGIALEKFLKEKELNHCYNKINSVDNFFSVENEMKRKYSKLIEQAKKKELDYREQHISVKKQNIENGKNFSVKF